MAVRQYIGARYVAKIYVNSLDPSSADWESGVAYEPLTMVTYNSSSYISRKAVTASIGNPADNPEYWAVTGLYNGQIAQLQNDVDALEAQNGSETLTTTAQTLSGAINELNYELLYTANYDGTKTIGDLLTEIKTVYDALPDATKFKAKLISDNRTYINDEKRGRFVYTKLTLTKLEMEQYLLDPVSCYQYDGTITDITSNTAASNIRLVIA